MKKLDSISSFYVMKTTKKVKIISSLIILVASMSIVLNNAWADDDHVPLWTKKLSDWWYQGNISDVESVNAFRYLVDNKIIQVSGLGFNHAVSFDKQVQQTRMFSSFLWNESGTSSDFKPNTSVTHNSKLHYIFVQASPSWAPYANTLVPNAINYWENTDNTKFIYSTPDKASITVRWLKEPDSKYAGYTVGGMAEVALGDGKCDGTWHAYDVDFVTAILKHELGHALGFGHSTNTADVMYPIILGEKYAPIRETFTLLPNDSIFVHVCTFSHTSTFHYSVKSDNEKNTLDIFFVPSKIEYDKFVDGKKFNYYKDDGCFGTKNIFYDGNCSNVSNQGGLIIRPSNDNQPQQNVTLTVDED